MNLYIAVVSGYPQYYGYPLATCDTNRDTQIVGVYNSSESMCKNIWKYIYDEYLVHYMDSILDMVEGLDELGDNEEDQKYKGTVDALYKTYFKDLESPTDMKTIKNLVFYFSSDDCHKIQITTKQVSIENIDLSLI